MQDRPEWILRASCKKSIQDSRSPTPGFFGLSEWVSPAAFVKGAEEGAPFGYNLIFPCPLGFVEGLIRPAYQILQVFTRRVLCNSAAGGEGDGQRSLFGALAVESHFFNVL